MTDDTLMSPPVDLESGDADSGADHLHREAFASLPVAAAILDPSGLVREGNQAFADLIQQPGEQISGEPFLTWLGRASEREAFGRAFGAMRSRSRSFTLELALVPTWGAPLTCRVHAARLQDGAVLVTCQPTDLGMFTPEAQLGLAITRSLDALDQGVLMVGEAANIVHANPAAKSLFGAGIIGRNLLELASGETVTMLGRALAMAKTGSWQGTAMLRQLDGEELPVEISLATGPGPAVVLVRDLRERRRREFEERLTGQVDRCLVASTDPRHSVISAAAALREGIGASAAVVLAKTKDGWQRWNAGELRGAGAELPAHAEPPPAWERTELAAIDPHDPQTRTWFGALPGARFAVRVALRAQSGLIGYLALARREDEPWDRRDQALAATVGAQIALGLTSGLLTLETRALAAYQAMVLDQTSVLLDSLDADGKVVTWNRASEHLLGFSPDQARGRRFGEEVATAVDGQWTSFWDVLRRDGVVAREILLRARGGDEIPLHLEGRLLREGEEIRGAVLVGLDLRDRRALESQILRSQKLAAVGLLAAGIAHEINNPLSGVVGYSKLLLERDLPPDIRNKVEKIAVSGDRCRKIVEGVLLFSRRQEGGIRRQVDLRHLLDRVLGIGEYQWKMHNVRIVREHNEAVCVEADSDQIEQVVLNLLSNAVDAMPRGGTIRLSLRQTHEGGAHLSVADEGHGIPEDIQSRIFDPFFSTKEIGKGTGLGLAISYGIVQDHGGDIVVRSTVGSGTEFTVTLPPVPPPRALPKELPPGDDISPGERPSKPDPNS